MPVTAIAVGALLALLASVIVPLALPAVVGANTTFTETLCPAARLIGNVGPVAENTAAEELNEDRVTAVPPEFVTENVCEPVLPTFTFPTLRLAALAESLPAATAAVPVALTPIVVGALLALLDTVITPVAAPAVVGVNTTVKGTDWPGLMSIGKTGPAATNVVEDELTPERIAVMPPVFVTEKLCVAVLPTVTLPKLNAVELAAIMPGCCCCVETPLTAMLVGVPLALLVTAIVPVKLPVFRGAKFTLNETLCPAAILVGSVTPVDINEGLEELILESTTAARPPLVTETDCAEFVPTTTLPKLRFTGLTDRPAAVRVFAPPSEGPTGPA